MSQLADAIGTHSDRKYKDSRTENNMVAHSTTGSKCVDLFFAAGSSRGSDITNMFKEALREDEDTALRILLWMRDVRGGAGERKLFRDLTKWLGQNHPAAIGRIFHSIPKVGRWDDYFSLLNIRYDINVEIFDKFYDAWADDNVRGLAAKWLPRKGSIAKQFQKAWGLTPRGYRKELVEATSVVETKMCENKWHSIEYGKVPSVAAARYQRAFSRHDPDGYELYRQSLEKGTGKVCAGAVYPYDVIKSIKYGDARVADAQWKALPDYLAESDKRIMPIVDVSGSMMSPVGGNSNVTCMDVSVSLGLYLAERNKGIFKDEFITFSGRPLFHKIVGSTLRERILNIERASWSMNTNLDAALKLILDAGVRYNVPESEMPNMLLIISDMQFDQCADFTGFEMIRQRYEASGYICPDIVFWNVASNNRGKGTNPAQVNNKGVALVSGFSPSIMVGILGAKEITPYSVMIETVGNERYNLDEPWDI